MSALVEFLHARLNEAEAWARVAQDASDDSPWRAGSGRVAADVFTAAGLRVAESRSANVARHVAGHDPARVLADVAAKRAILEDFEVYERDAREAPSEFARGRRHAALLAVTRLAAAYAGHPDYRQEWRP